MDADPIAAATASASPHPHTTHYMQRLLIERRSNSSDADISLPIFSGSRQKKRRRKKNWFHFLDIFSPEFVVVLFTQSYSPQEMMQQLITSRQNEYREEEVFRVCYVTMGLQIVAEKAPWGRMKVKEWPRKTQHGRAKGWKERKRKKTFSILYLWQQLPPSCCLTRSKVLHPAATQIDGQLDVK